MVKSKQIGDQLIVYLNEEIDHCSAERLRKEIELLIKDSGACKLIMDFSSVNFMDSSGIGMIIGRYKTMCLRGGSLTVYGLHPPVDQLFQMAGLHRIIKEETTEGQVIA